MFSLLFKQFSLAFFGSVFSCFVVFSVCNSQRPPLPPHPGMPPLPKGQNYLMIGKKPKTLADMITMLQRTQAMLLQMTIRIGQLESRQSMILKGRDGRDGHDGKQGLPGRDGRDGKDGPRGPTGADGAPGQPGRDGKDGEDGKPGPKGDPGKPGARGPPDPRETMQEGYSIHDGEEQSVLLTVH